MIKSDEESIFRMLGKPKEIHPRKAQRFNASRMQKSQRIFLPRQRRSHDAR